MIRQIQSWLEASILIADDSEANRRLLQRILEREGLTQIHTANDGTSALAAAQSIDPDIVLLDLHMPGLSGFEVLEQLRGWLPPETYLPVLVITADASEETKRAALAAGAMDFVTKPFDALEVVLRVRNLLHTRYLHRHMEAKVAERTQALAEANHEILRRLAHAGEFRDEGTGRHTQRVGELAALVARELGLDEPHVELIRHTAPLHDVGKIGVSDSILLKSGRLTDDEWIEMKRHTTLGAMILSEGHVDLIRTAERIALCHHERWDGTGYPRGLSGTAIPVEARIVAVVDVYDALCHDRPYRTAWSPEDAIAEIRNGSGSHFDPKVLSAFEAVVGVNPAPHTSSPRRRGPSP